MANRYLIVIDMQNDFVTGPLGTPEAAAIAQAVAERARAFEGTVAFTLDTHDETYAQTQEGRNLPVPHCLRGSDGWQLIPELAAVRRVRGTKVFEKPSFGSPALAAWLEAEHAARPIDGIELCGVCTDICVVSNALLIKAALPEVPVSVDARLCAGVTSAAHEAALTTMASCQVEVLGR
ncbi:MAG: cysteine hydrolase [Coriobacteriaceae bacterium]|nr:cysteine hydrolase [Coriobacteriaceae bacterium]